MEKRAVPDTDLELSILSFGAGYLAGLMVGGSRQEQLRVTAKALELGINHFDTSRVYGEGRSEDNLGATLKELRSDAYVSTKVNIDQQVLAEGHLGRSVRRLGEESLKRLRRDYIDVLLIHNSARFVRRLDHALLPGLTFDDIFGEDGVYSGVLELMDAGKVRHFGLGGAAGNEDIGVTRAAVATGRARAIHVNCSLLNPTVGWPAGRDLSVRPAFLRDTDPDLRGLLDFDQSVGIGSFVISPLGGGVLTDTAQSGRLPPPVSNHNLRYPQPGQFSAEVARAAHFQALAAEVGLSLTDLALRFAFHVRGVTTVLVGISDMAQLIDATRCADAGPLGADVLEGLNQIFSSCCARTLGI
jgi:aryl-alcohol dehydrogenase-like predicted oxidoreductase